MNPLKYFKIDGVLMKVTDILSDDYVSLACTCSINFYEKTPEKEV